MTSAQKDGSNPSGNGPSPLEKPLKTRLPALLGLWLVFVAVLFLPYLGIYLMGFRLIEWWKFLSGAIPLAATVVLLLEMDKHEQSWTGHVPIQNGTQMAPQQPVVGTEAVASGQATADSGKGAPGMSVAELVYKLFVQRKSLVALFVLCITVTVLITYRFASLLFRVEYAGEAGMVVHLPGETVYYVPLYPYSLRSPAGHDPLFERSWQKTAIKLNTDDEFTVEISGMVSPGILQNSPEMFAWAETDKKWWEWCKDIVGKKQARSKQECDDKNPEQPAPLLKWPFTGPEGYDPAWYPPKTGNNFPQDEERREPNHKYIDRNYQDDDGLTVKGVPHNWIIGLILPEGDEPRHYPQPQYDYAKEKAGLINFSGKQCKYPRDYKAHQTGILWVVVNDADAYRWDNEGWFLLKLTKHVPGIPRGQHGGPCPDP